ncbi:hypothetical protein RRG08_014097 [Elysia crispata]|uniref:Uncharacterized protein n=1 Tax=Elysia crispata TaxID=231223 RepID=A0AAE0XR34_9GAST|nr:hypothetical protein RRG08_014097 [Elysia crispata]
MLAVSGRWSGDVTELPVRTEWADITHPLYRTRSVRTIASISRYLSPGIKDMLLHSRANSSVYMGVKPRYFSPRVGPILSTCE